MSEQRKREEATSVLHDMMWHCVDCASGLRAAAEVVRDRGLSAALNLRAASWEQAVQTIAEQLAGDTGRANHGTVRAALFRAMVKIHAGVRDEQAIVDDCSWWDALARKQCADAGALLDDLVPGMSGSRLRTTAPVGWPAFESRAGSRFVPG